MTEKILSDEVVVLFQNGIKWFREDKVKEFIQKLKGFSTTHSCPDEDNKDLDLECSCYNKRIEDQNCWVIPKKKLDKLAGEFK